MGRPYEVTCIRYYYGIFPRYRDDIFVRQKSLHMCPTSTLYITYGKLWSDVHRTVGRRSNVWWDELFLQKGVPRQFSSGWESFQNKQLAGKI